MIVYIHCRDVIDLLDSPVHSLPDDDSCSSSDDESKYTLNTASKFIGTYAVL